MYASKKRNISVWDNNRNSYHNEKTELPPPPPVPPHRTLPSETTIHSSSSSQLMRCTSMPHAAKPAITISNPNTTTNPSVPARPMSWHPIPSRNTSRFCQNDPEIKAKLDRIAQSDRLLSLRTRIMHS